MVILADQLRHLPQTVEAMSAGKISTAQAVEVARGATAEPHAEERLLNLAKSATVRTLRDEASRVIAAATDEVERHKRIHKNRCLKTWTDQDGAFNLKAQMTVANGALVLAALKPLQDEIFKASRKSGEHATPEAYAADALLALCAAKTVGIQGSSATKLTRASAVINIRVDIDALKRGHTEGGAASLKNLVRLCKRHHLQKTHDGYRLIARRYEDSGGEPQLSSEPRWVWRAPGSADQEASRDLDLSDTG